MKPLHLTALRMQGLLILCIALVTMGGISFYLISKAQTEAMVAAEQRSLLLARSFAEHARATVRLVDLAALQLANAWTRGPRDFESQVKRTSVDISDISLQVGVVDAAGWVVYSDLGLPAQPLNLKDREHIRFQLDSNEDRLFISKPLKGRVSNKWSIQFTRPVRRDGRNVGVLVLSVDPGYFNRYYTSITLDKNDVVAIIRSSGDVLARAPALETIQGMKITSLPFLNDNAAAPMEGNFRRFGQVDGVMRTFGYYTLRDHNLTVTAGLADSSAMAHFVSQRNLILMAAGVLSLALMITLIVSIRSLEDRERLTLKRAVVSEESFAQLVDSATDYAFIRLDPNGLVTSWNNGAQRTYGYATAEILGRSFACLYLPQDRASSVPAQVLQAAGTSGRHEFTGYHLRKDGSQFWANVAMRALHDSEGAVSGFVKVTRDITELRHVEEQLRESQKLEAIGQLTGGLAHDFNNLLGVVVGNLDMIGEQLPDSERVRRQHQAALDAALRGAEVTRSLLAVARRQKMAITTQDVNKLIIETLPLLRASAGSAIHVETLLSPEVLLARLDTGGLSQVLLNLTINARDSMSAVTNQKTLTLRTLARQTNAQSEPTLTPGLYVLIEVADNGSGMSQAVRTQAFEPFFTTKERSQGTGLGLAMVYGYATQLGGTARIQSEPGVGTTVSLWLPCTTGSAVTAATAATPHDNALSAAIKHHVLVVDDEPDLCDLASDWLESLGYKVSTAHSPAQALQALAGANPPVDILFSDVVMPGDMDGIALARAALAQYPQLQVLLTSGYAPSLLNADEIPGKLLGKPYRKNQLKQAIDALASSAEPNREPAASA